MYVDFHILNELGTPALFSNTFANRGAAGQVGRLFISTDTYEIYRDNGTSWDLIGSGSSGGVTGSGTATQVAFWDSSSSIAGNSNLYYNPTFAWLGIGTNVPLTKIHAKGADNTLQILEGTGTTNSLLAYSQATVLKYHTGYNYGAGTYPRFEIYDEVGAKNVLGILQSSRFVGINYQFTGATDVPRYTFDVFGNVGATGTFDFGADTITRLTSTATAITTKYLGIQRGLKIDFSNNLYNLTGISDLGLTINENNGITKLGDYLGNFGAFNYLVIDSGSNVIGTYFDVNNVGLKLDFLLNNYFLGSAGLNGNFARIELVCPDVISAYYSFYNTGGDADGLIVQFNTGFSYAQLGFSNSGNSNYLTVDDGNNIIQTLGNGNVKGLKLDFANSFYWLGDYNYTASGVSFVVNDLAENIYTKYQGNEIGLKLDFANGVYQIGDYGGVGPFSAVSLNIEDDAGWLYTKFYGGMIGIKTTGQDVFLADFNSNVNGTWLQVSDSQEKLLVSGNLASSTASGSSGQHLKITVGGVDYKIALLNP